MHKEATRSAQCEDAPSGCDTAPMHRLMHASIALRHCVAALNAARAHTAAPVALATRYAQCETGAPIAQGQNARRTQMLATQRPCSTGATPPVCDSPQAFYQVPCGFSAVSLKPARIFIRRGSQGCFTSFIAQASFCRYIAFCKAFSAFFLSSVKNGKMLFLTKSESRPPADRFFPFSVG